MSSLRGLGCLPDAPYARGSHDLWGVVGMTSSINGWTDLTPLCDTPPDQGGTETCYAQSASSAIMIAGRRTNPTFSRPSRLLIADMARGVAGMRGTDIGCSIGATLQGVAAGGFCAESDCPWDESEVLQHRYADEYQAAILQVGLRTHRAIGDFRSIARAALAAGRGIIATTDADQSLQDWQGGGIWPGISGPKKGGHAQTVVFGDDDSAKVFGSWGPWFADGGFMRIAWTAINGLWIVDAAPEYWRES